MTGQSSRRNDFDWLRILAVLLLVPFHSALIFALDPRYQVYIKDRVQSDFLIAIASFINLWHMPLFFVIAGASTWYALAHRTPTEYRRERQLRLLVPFVFGVLILIPAMTYIHLIGTPNSPSFWQHYLGFFVINPSDLAGLNGTFTPAHLWFIIFLFVFSMTGLRIFLRLRSSKGAAFVAALAPLLAQRLMLLILFVPLTLASFLPILGDKNPVYYFMTFVAGYFLVTDKRFQDAIDRDGWLYLLLSLMATPVFLYFQRMPSQWPLGWIGMSILFNFLRWSWVLAILALGHRFLNVSSAALPYCSEGAYPFYILHLPIDTLVAYFVIQSGVSIGVKYVSICLLTILATLAIYDLIVRRHNVLRFLFGMKPLQREKTLAQVALNTGKS